MKRDVDAGMIPMILDAQARVAKRGHELKDVRVAVVAARVDGPVERDASARCYVGDANGLDPKHARVGQLLLAVHIGVPQAGDRPVVTVQNEPEAAVGGRRL